VRVTLMENGITWPQSNCQAAGMSDVFVDYHPRDRDAAHEVGREFARRGLSSFLIDRDLSGSEAWGPRVAREAAGARVVVVLWSASAAVALKKRGALERAAAFIRYWSEGRLVLAQLDRTELPLGLRQLVTVPLRVDMFEQIADAAGKLITANSRAMMDLGDHDWQGITQVWTPEGAADKARAPAERVASRPASRDRQAPRTRRAPAAATPQARPVAVEEQLFVSYARSDLPRVDPIVSEILALGFPVWIDRHEISSETGWAGQLTRAIKGTRAVVLMASAASYGSDQVVREMYLAMNAKKKIVPLELEPAPMNDEFEYILAPFQRFKIDTGPREAVLSLALKSL
jgi:hypothetical protein